MNIWHPGLSGLIRGTAVVMLYRDSLNPIGAAATINFYRWIYLPKEAKEENRMAQHWNFFQRYFYIQTRNENARRLGDKRDTAAAAGFWHSLVGCPLLLGWWWLWIGSHCEMWGLLQDVKRQCRDCYFSWFLDDYLCTYLSWVTCWLADCLAEDEDH